MHCADSAAAGSEREVVVAGAIKAGYIVPEKNNPWRG